MKSNDNNDELVRNMLFLPFICSTYINHIVGFLNKNVFSSTY